MKIPARWRPQRTRAGRIRVRAATRGGLEGWSTTTPRRRTPGRPLPARRPGCRDAGPWSYSEQSLQALSGKIRLGYEAERPAAVEAGAVVARVTAGHEEHGRRLRLRTQGRG